MSETSSVYSTCTHLDQRHRLWFMPVVASMVTYIHLWFIQTCSWLLWRAVWRIQRTYETQPWCFWSWWLSSTLHIADSCQRKWCSWTRVRLQRLSDNWRFFSSRLFVLFLCHRYVIADNTDQQPLRSQSRTEKALAATHHLHVESPSDFLGRIESTLMRFMTLQAAELF